MFLYRFLIGATLIAGLSAGRAQAAFVDDFDNGDPLTIAENGPQVWESYTVGGNSSIQEANSRLIADAQSDSTDTYVRSGLVTQNALDEANFFAGSTHIVLTGWNTSKTGGGASGIQTEIALQSTKQNKYNEIEDGLALWWGYDGGHKVQFFSYQDGTKTLLFTLTQLETQNINFDEIFDVDMRLDATDYQMKITDQHGNTETMSGQHGLDESSWNESDGDAYLLLNSTVGGKSNQSAILTLDKISVTQVPEPAGLSMLAAASSLTWLLRRRRNPERQPIG